jgi:hypothetical protein
MLAAFISTHIYLIQLHSYVENGISLPLCKDCFRLAILPFIDIIGIFLFTGNVIFITQIRSKFHVKIIFVSNTNFLKDLLTFWSDGRLYDGYINFLWKTY